MDPRKPHQTKDERSQVTQGDDATLENIWYTRQQRQRLAALAIQGLDPASHLPVHSSYPTDLARCSFPLCGLCATFLIKHPGFSYCAPLALTFGSACSRLVSCIIQVRVDCPSSCSPLVVVVRAVMVSHIKGTRDVGLRQCLEQPAEKQRMPIKTGRERRWSQRWTLTP
uniref:Uncharacterized protein n=1 Tax=Triticum urartu TaxID=4572 RepID=A0A8R7RG70_TRIUA